ncbi:uncharacterized protein At2g29880-like isoform X2 [Tasmannia lanceolata]
MSEAAKSKGNYEQWSAQESRELLKLLVDEAKNGGRQADGSFSKNLITKKVLPALNSKLRCHKTYDHVRSKLRVWQRTYKPIAKLMSSNSRFEWDPLTQKITAPEEVWDAYLVAHPEVVNYKVKAIENFDDLKVVVGHKYAVNYITKRISKACVDKAGVLDDIMLDEDVLERGDVLAAHAPSQGPPNQSTASPVQRKRRYDEATSSHQRPRSAAESTELIAKSLADIAVELKVLNSRSAIHHDWLKAVNEIPNLEEELRFRAGEFLNTPEFKEQFIEMDVETRRRFLRWRSRHYFGYEQEAKTTDMKEKGVDLYDFKKHECIN